MGNNTTVEQNKQVVIRFNNEFFAKGNTEIAKELLSNTFVNHTAAPNAPTDASAMIQFITAFHQGFSDISIEIFEVLSEGNKVSLRKTITGTHTKSLPQVEIPIYVEAESVKVYHTSGLSCPW